MCIIRYNRQSDFRFIVKKLAFSARRRLKVAFCSQLPTHTELDFFVIIVGVVSTTPYFFAFFELDRRKTPFSSLYYVDKKIF